MPFFMIVFLSFALTTLACDGGMKLAKNMSIPANSALANDVTEAQFRGAIKSFEQFFGPEIERQYNAELIVIGSWASNTVNAYAEQSERKAMITIYGGLARHPHMTLDGFKATLCHELGHHFGGYPKKSTNKWSSAEGQSDYYATMKCLRRLWAKEDNLSAIRNLVIPDKVKRECVQTFSKYSDQYLCARMSMAGMAISLMIQALDHDSIEPKFETPDTTVARAMNYLHPYAQCRLDTYFNGAICPVSESVEFDDVRETVGSCHQKNGDVRGLRPRCWFVPRI